MIISTSNHPLEPLTAEEITAAVRILRAEKDLNEFYRFASINLLEPPKELVLRWSPGDSFEREAFCIVLNHKEEFRNRRRNGGVCRSRWVSGFFLLQLVL